MDQKNIHTDIAIVGAGIGGFAAFQALSKLLKKKKLNKTITLIDRNNYFVFTPLLHEAASGSVEPDHCARSLIEVASGTPHRFIKADVNKIEPEKNLITADGINISYDYCVLGLGSEVNYYGVPGADIFSYSVRTLTEAIRLKKKFISSLENDEPLSVTVVGGGFTGIETIGQLAYMARRGLKKLYHRKKIEFNLIQNVSALAPQLPALARKKITDRLIKLGVNIWLNSEVKEMRESKIILKDNQLVSDITVWCAGFKSVAEKFFDAKYCERGRVPVTGYLNHGLAPNLYAVGDVALGHNVNDNTPFPQLAETAEKQGKYVAKHIIATFTNKKSAPFFFKSWGTLMPIGDKYGLAIFGNLIFGGIFAWWLRRTVYVFFMPDSISKIKIIFDWTLRLFGADYVVDTESKQKRD